MTHKTSRNIVKQHLSCQLKTVSAVYKTLLWTLGLDRCCLLCGASSPIAQPFCPGCQRELPWLDDDTCCPRCSLPDSAGHLCKGCSTDAFAFDDCIAAAAYRWPLDRLIGAFKYHDRPAVLPALADPLLLRLQQHYRTQPWPQLLLSVPQHPQRLRERGVDQAALLARYLSRSTGIAYRRRLLKRLRHTPSQQALSTRDRHRNIRGAFALCGHLPQTHIALIDDVVTSGATVSELARLLRQAGATRVDIWALARTPLTEHQQP